MISNHPVTSFIAPT